MFKVIIDKLRAINTRSVVDVLIKIIMFSISVVAMAIEGQFDYVKIRQFVSSPFDVLLSGMLPAFTSFGVESSIILKRQGAGATSVALKAMVGLSMAFSLIMITAGQFDKNNTLLNADISIRQESDTNKSLHELNLSEQVLLNDEITQLMALSNENGIKLNKAVFNSPEYWTIWGVKSKIDDNIKTAKDKLDIVNAEIRKELSENKIVTVEKKDTTIYDVIGKIINKSPELIQFILFLILPIFVVFMAPFGMYVALGLYKKDTLVPSPRRPRQRLDISAQVETWVNYNWIGMRNNKSEMILPKSVFLEFIAGKGERFSVRLYDRIFSLSEKSGVTLARKIIEKDEQQAVKKILTFKGK